MGILPMPVHGLEGRVTSLERSLLIHMHNFCGWEAIE